MNEKTTFKNSNQPNEFLKQIYDPELKGNNLQKSMSYPQIQFAKEVDFIKQFKVETNNDKQLPSVIHIQDRNSLTGIAVFMPSNHYNMRLCSDVPEHVKARYDADWKFIEPLQKASATASSVVFALDEPKDRHEYILVYFDISAEMAHERLVNRGRECESTCLSLEYMRELHKLQKEFITGENITRSIPAATLYQGRKYKIETIDVEKYNVEEEDEKREAAVNGLMGEIRLRLEI